MTKLVIYEEIENEETIFEDFELMTQRILIGSGLDNQLVLDAPDIDPTHASLELRNGQWTLQDLGGPGGTAVNGQIINGPYSLRHDDLIELGSIKIKFEEYEESEPELETDPKEVVIRGRTWFLAITGVTLAILFIILLLLIVADFLGLLKISDLLPLALYLTP